MPRVTNTGRKLIVISTSYNSLPEQGEAYCVDKDGNVLARFIDGNLESLKPVFKKESEEETLGPIA
jgi:hypothetical protein